MAILVDRNKDPCFESNYSPVSVFSMLSKSFECSMYGQTDNFMREILAHDSARNIVNIYVWKTERSTRSPFCSKCCLSLQP